MCMALSLKYAPKDPTNHAEKARFYTRVQEICQEFKKENGSIICRELLGLSEGPSSPIPQERTAQYYAKRPCADKVKNAAEILEKYLQENKII
jgi:hypothetical protein